MGTQIDWAAEGLLAGLEGKAARSRERLLTELIEEGVPLEELRGAVAEGRLALVAVERALRGEEARYSAPQLAELSGIEREFLDRQWRALGMAIPADEEVLFGERDLESARRVAAARAAGVPDEGILEISRLLGMTMSQLAAANRTMIGEAFVGADDTEYEVAERLAGAAKMFMPMVAESLSYVLNLHLRAQIRHDALEGGGRGASGADATQAVTVCFADLVGFTRLGESLAPEELGAVTGRLAELASEVVEPPVRLVKLIGDAAMIVGPDPAGVLDAALALVEGAEAEGEDFPVLRAGVAVGDALARGGDWYGRPVNLASRITSRARPGSVLASEEVHEALGDAYRWSFAGAKRLKGIDGEPRLYRARRLTGE